MKANGASSAAVIRWFGRAAVAIFVLLLLVGPASDFCAIGWAAEGEKAVMRDRGQDSLPKGDLYAVIVGISKYANPAVPPLKISDKDARDFADFLRTQKDLFRQRKVTLLTNEQATKIEVEKQLFYGLRQAGKNDTVILFFSGHGAVDPYQAGDFFFLTYDSDPDYLAPTAVHMSGLNFLKRIDCPRVLLIADACNAGGFSARGTKLAVTPFKSFIEQFTSSSGKVILTSSRPDEYSLEKPGMNNSVFTHYLLEGLRGRADGDGDGLVTISEAYRYVYEKTKRESGGVQHPQFEGTVEGVFAIAHSGRPEQIPVATERPAGPADHQPAAIPIDRRLIAAVRAGDLNNVQRLIRESADINVADELGWTPLMHTASKNNLKAAQLLISAGADVNTQDRLGWSALMIAAANGHAEVVDMLLKQGADKNARNIYGETAEMKASLGKHSRVLRILSRAAPATERPTEKPAATPPEGPVAKPEKPKTDKPIETVKKKVGEGEDSKKYKVDLPPINYDDFAGGPRFRRGSSSGGGIGIGIGPLQIRLPGRRGREESSESD
ncbi:MAG: ankyrin repeat domain-containing protein [Desulfomonile sp.]|nr:ankyrin repeat domain-containing protein [Desulfomonile sp.]